MKPIYIDHSLITAFFLKSHPFHAEAVEMVALLLQEEKEYVTSLESMYEACKILIEEIQSAKDINLTNKILNPEKMVINKVHSFMRKLRINILTTTNEHVLSQILAITTEYNIPFTNGFFAAIMMEHKIKTVATVDSSYDALISDGFLNKYGTD